MIQKGSAGLYKNQQRELWRVSDAKRQFETRPNAIRLQGRCRGGIAAIKQEEALASVNHSIAEVDRWEAAHFKEDEIRNKVTAAQKRYEDALRQKFFRF